MLPNLKDHKLWRDPDLAYSLLIQLIDKIPQDHWYDLDPDESMTVTAAAKQHLTAFPLEPRWMQSAREEDYAHLVGRVKQRTGRDLIRDIETNLWVIR